jgi:SAM-dependent methyltransferase
MKRKKCLFCSSKRMTKIIDLGNHPFADTFIPEDRINDRLPVYNLSCARCDKCNQIQTLSATNPVERYGLYDYSYTSSNSKTSRNHWLSYASEVVSKIGLKEGNFVVDIGSNDGFLIRSFRENSIDGLGVDASPYMANMANEIGVPTIVGLFGSEIKDQIIDTYGKANLVVANNVLNHSEDPVGFVKSVYDLLLDNGHFVFELPYWKISVESGKIDQVYHEHVSYFTASISKKLLESVGFTITHIEVVDYHGGSLRVYASKNIDAKQCPNLPAMIESEASIFKKSTYTKLMKEMSSKRFDFMNKIYDIKNNGGKIIAIGAAAKGNTLLNYLNLNDSLIDWVTDVSDFKRGKRTPLSNIPICGDDIFAEYGEVYALILSWNLSDIIKEKLLRINSKIKFLNFYD